MTPRNRVWGLWSALALVLAVGGCDCSPSGPSLAFLEPLDGAVLSAEDDLDPATSEVDVDVRLATEGIAGETVELFLDVDPRDAVVPPDPTVVGTPADDGTVTLRVALTYGVHTLYACARDCDLFASISVRVSDGCPRIDFVEPVVRGGRVVLGGPDDTDGEACGAEFTTTFVVSTDAGDGASVTLYVNGVATATTTVSGTVARFEGVVLGNRGLDVGDENRVEAQVGDMDACRADLGAPVFVDCDGASCEITRPDVARRFLNASDDTSADPGFQTTIDVTTDEDGAGQDVTLLVDGAEAGTATPMAEGSGGVATFVNVALEEGDHRVQAECRDEAGNVTRSTPAMWTVDTTPCEVSIAEPIDGQLFVDADDLDEMTGGIQVAASGATSGGDCVSVAAGLCDTTSEVTLAADGSWSGTITLPTSSGMHEVCAVVTDEAGNTAESRVTVRVRTDAPQLAIDSPSDGVVVNVAGSGGAIADADPATTSCEVAFEVWCTEVGEDVEIRLEGSDTALPGGTASCEADASAMAPYRGKATFANVSVPTRNDGTAHRIVAVQQADRLTGVSAPISLTADCMPPGFAFYSPDCGDVLRPSSDDVDPATPGFQMDVRVTVQGGASSFDFELLDAMGSAAYSQTGITATGLSTVFRTDALPGGVFDMRVCGTDSAGNRACTMLPCPLTIADLPTVSITTPADGSTVTALPQGTGCTGNELQVTIATDAADGSEVRVQVGAFGEVTTTVASGSASVCAPAGEGRSLTVSATVDDPVKGMASATVTVDIDTQAPADAVSDLSATVVDRRAAALQFDWTSVEDAGGFLLERWELRCAENGPMASEADWSAATVYTVATTPAAAGTSQQETVSGFRTGPTYRCALRGVDVAGRWTPLPMAPTEVTISFAQRRLDAPMGAALFGRSAANVGDVNGDGVDDLLVGAPQSPGAASSGRAYLYFGPVTSGATPDVTFTSTNWSFGHSLAALGDFNGDGQADFAIGEGARGAFQGAVYVFFGRSSGSSWPASVDASLGGCGADVCFYNDQSLALFGWSVGSADFDGDGVSDLLVGAPRDDQGTLYVLLGGSSVAGTYNIPATPTGAMTEPRGFYLTRPTSGSTNGDGFGNDVGSLGDVNGDGRGDLVVGADASPDTLWTVAGVNYDAMDVGLQPVSASAATLIDSGVGIRVAAGDFNGDGRTDIFGYDEQGGDQNGGSIRLYLATASGYAGMSAEFVSLTASGQSGDAFGFVLATGDLDGDGRSDLLAGSRQNLLNPGTVEGFYGRPMPPNPWDRSDASFSYGPMSAAMEGRFGFFVRDMTGDGVADWILGDPSNGSIYLMH